MSASHMNNGDLDIGHQHPGRLCMHTAEPDSRYVSAVWSKLAMAIE